MSAGDSNSMVFDAHSGRNVWHYQLGCSMRATVGTTYMLDGRQYLLAPAGSMLTGFALPAERGDEKSEVDTGRATERPGSVPKPVQHSYEQSCRRPTDRGDPVRRPTSQLC
jgi:hypothetical protein